MNARQLSEARDIGSLDSAPPITGEHSVCRADTNGPEGTSSTLYPLRQPHRHGRWFSTRGDVRRRAEATAPMQSRVDELAQPRCRQVSRLVMVRIEMTSWKERLHGELMQPWRPTGIFTGNRQAGRSSTLTNGTVAPALRRLGARPDFVSQVGDVPVGRPHRLRQSGKVQRGLAIPLPRPSLEPRHGGYGETALR